MGLYKLVRPKILKTIDSPKEDRIEVEGKVVVMADFSSSGLWLPNKEYIAGGGMIDTTITRLPWQIIKELDDWIFAFEAMWANQYFKVIKKRVLKFNAWGKIIAGKIKEFYKNSAEVWYCYQEEDCSSYNIEDIEYIKNKFCVVTRKSDNVTLGCFLVKAVEVIGIEQNLYYPVVGTMPEIGTKFIPIKSKKFTGCFEWVPEGF